MGNMIDRRKFLAVVGAGAIAGTWPVNGFARQQRGGPPLPPGWVDPAREFSLGPFWFWNDQLSKKEIARQLDDFCEHGVYGFVIHPRTGLPRSIGWMSDAMIDYMRFAIEEAEKNRILDLHGSGTGITCTDLNLGCGYYWKGITL